MKTLASESYNIAWFKLADFVARGEKERALSVLRLLMHSVSNEALTYQLEGDILTAFNDLTALERYHTAGNLFTKTQHFQQAVCVYQQALLLKEDEKILQGLLETYAMSKNKIGILDTFSKIAKILIEKQSHDELNSIFQQTLKKIDETIQTLLHARYATSLLLHDPKNEKISEIIATTIDLFYKNFPSKTLVSSDLQKFLIEIKVLSPKEYKKMKISNSVHSHEDKNLSKF